MITENFVLMASEAAGEASTPAWVFGLFGFGVLVGLLILTMMIKVDR
jgi:hypothetical protein